MQVRKQQLEPYMEPYTEPYMKQLTGSKLGKEYDKDIYCHPVYSRDSLIQKLSISIHTH